MSYSPPLIEQRFVLDCVTDVQTLAKAPEFAAVTPDLIDAILEGVAALAKDKWAPLNRVGDTVLPTWLDGCVTMPPGFGEAYNAYVDGGWGSISAPQAFGGQGLPFVLAIAVQENLGTANMAFRLCPMLTMGAVEALVVHGSAEQQAAYLPKLVSGEWTGTMNLTEPQAGSDVGALRTSALPNADGSWSIKGTKIYITFGEHDLTENIIHLVLARTPDAPAGTKGISLFLVPKILPDGTTNDLRCVSIEHKLGIHASPTCMISFGDDEGAKGWLIGSEMAGMPAMFTMMNNARLNVGLQGVEVAERATQAALAYAQDRVQLKPIIEHPDVRRMLLRMKALTQGARALVYFAAGYVDRTCLEIKGARARLDLLTPLAKAWATEIGCEVASLGIQVHGGMGFIEETGAAQYYRDARIAPIYEGTNGIQAADLVGRKLMGDSGKALFALLDDIRKETRHDQLLTLIDDVEETARWMLTVDVDDRLAGSTAFLHMCAVAVAGWLMERQKRIADEGLSLGLANRDFFETKSCVSAFFLTHMIPEAVAQKTSAMAGAADLCRLKTDLLARAF